MGSSIWLGNAAGECSDDRVQTPVGPALQGVLFMAGIVSELSEDAVRAVWQRWLGPQRFERKLEQFVRRGWMETQARPGDTARIIHLTSAGRMAALGGRDPPGQWERAWDGRWRLVLFDVPEPQRALRLKLRKTLRKLGFGYLQKSVWISPDPVGALKAAVGAAAIDVEALLFLEAHPCGGESDTELVQGAWDFDWINRGYDEYETILDSAPTLLGGHRAWRNWFKVEWRAWHRAVSRDPLLPRALHPPSYRGCDAWQRRSQTFARLLRPA